MDMTPLSTGTKKASLASPLPTNGVGVLSGEIWLETVTALHEKVRAEMPESRRHFLLPKPPEYFRDLLNGKNGILFGAFADGELAGSMALVWEDSFAAARAAGRVTFPDTEGRLAKKYRKGSVGVIQAMGLQGAYMGRGFSRLLLQAAIDRAAQRGCAHLFAQAAEQNTLSWLRFLDQGFAIATAWTGGHRRFLLRWLSPEDRARLLRKNASVERRVFSKNYAQLPALLAELAARLAEGKIAFLDDRNDSGGLPFVFSR
ncbi:MAG: GNAT family N-acetyltransferase [Alphaproteobacteria bacterium]|nr:GNAT family N-acetyltransferase [Alphaproteobacteria bacterium]